MSRIKTSLYERTMSMPDLRKSRDIQLAAKMGGRKTLGSRSVSPDPNILKSTTNSKATSRATKSNRDASNNPFLTSSSTNYASTSMLSKLPPNKMMALEKRMTLPSQKTTPQKKPPPLLFDQLPLQESKSNRNPFTSVVSTSPSNLRHNPYPELKSSSSSSYKRRSLSLTALFQQEANEESKKKSCTRHSGCLNGVDGSEVIVAATPVKKRAFDIERIAESPL